MELAIFSEDGISGWSQAGSGIQALPGKGVDNSMAVGTLTWAHPWQHLGTHLDTRCFDSTDVGKKFELRARFRLVDNLGNNATCNPSKYLWEGGCPRITFKFEGHNNPNKESLWTQYHGDRAVAVPGYQPHLLNLLQGVFTMTQEYVDANRVYVYLEANIQDRVILDDVDIIPFTYNSCDDNLVKNGDFSTDGTYWYTFGSPNLELVPGIGEEGDLALRVTQRTSPSWSGRNYMDVDCLNIGDRVAVKARFKLESQADGSTFECDPYEPYAWDSPTRCSELFMRSSKKGFNVEYRSIGKTVYSIPGDGWMAIAGFYTVREVNFKPDDFFFYFDGARYKDLTIDNVSFERMPMDCTNLISNPSFEDGTSSFWFQSSRENSKLDLVGGTDSNYALRVYERAHMAEGVWQDLDPRCFVPGQEFTIAGKFRLLNGTANALCDPAITWWDNKQCQSVHIQAWGCDNPADLWMQFWDQGGGGLNSNDMSEFR